MSSLARFALGPARIAVGRVAKMPTTTVKRSSHFEMYWGTAEPLPSSPFKKFLVVVGVFITCYSAVYYESIAFVKRKSA